MVDFVHPDDRPVPGVLVATFQAIVNAWNATVAAGVDHPDCLPGLPPPLPDPGRGPEGVNRAYDSLRGEFGTSMPLRSNDLLALARYFGCVKPVTLGVGALAYGDPGTGVGATGDLPPFVPVPPGPDI